MSFSHRSFSHSQFDELGLKVKRAQEELANIRGVGVARGVTVEVDAENRLVSVDAPDGDRILAAYEAALADKRPRVDAALREVMTDPQTQAITAFVEANTDAVPATSAQAREVLQPWASDGDIDDAYYQQLRNDPLGHGG